MKNIVLVLSAFVLALGATSAYFFTQAGSADLRMRQAEEQIPQLQARIRTLETELSLKSDVEPHPDGGATQAQGASGPPRDTLNAQTNAADASDAKKEELLRMLRDPGSRALLRADEIAKLNAQNPGLQRALSLTDDMYQKLLELRAEQNLQFREIAPNGLVSEADIGQVAELRRRQRRELAASLGEKGIRDYDKYMAGTSERAEVRQLRSLLGAADQLTDEQATSLAMGLREERDQFTRELRAQGAASGKHLLFTGDGIVIASIGGAPAVSGSTADDEAGEKQLVDQMETYKKRIVNRASAVLNHEQLQAFEEMQERQIAAVRVSLRQARQNRAAVTQ